MWHDPIVAEVRRVREELAARFDFDVDAIFADLQRRQTESGRTLICRQLQPAGEAAESLAAELPRRSR